jgi:endoglycosylceramidase
MFHWTGQAWYPSAVRTLGIIRVAVVCAALSPMTGCGDDGPAAVDSDAAPPADAGLDAYVPLPEATACDPAAVAPPLATSLHTSGRDILDAAGRRITLRGVASGGRSKFAPYSPFDYTDGGYDAALAVYLDRAATWGIDVLRVPFSWQAAEPSPGVWDEVYLARYDALLDAAWARGLWTIVEFHQDVYAESFCGDGFPMWTLVDPDPPRHDCPGWFNAYFNSNKVKGAFNDFWDDVRGTRTAFRAMWQRMAERHRDRPGVIGYEVINEPSAGTTPALTWEREVLSPFYTEMIALLQAADPDALVFVDVSGVAGAGANSELPRPDGSGIVFAPHYYDPGSLFGGALNRDVTGALQRWADVGIAWETPVFLGEMGIAVEHPQAVAHLQRHLEALDNLDMHGTWWEYSVAAELWNGENLSIVEASGAETDLVDALARPFVQALAGERGSVTYDADARRLTVEYTPAAAGSSESGADVTEIALPSRQYAAGARVGGQGFCASIVDGKLLIRAEPGTASVRMTVEPAGG